MRILVLSDIHSNWQALKSIDEQFDIALCAGDIVDYGTDPAPCVEWVRSSCQHVIRGNHDHAVAQRIEPTAGRGLKAIAAAARPLHWNVLNPEQMTFLAELPVTDRFRVGDKSFYMVHATPRDPMDEYLRDDPGEWKDRLRGLEADFVLVGHTHQPYHIEVDGMQVINPGSVGQPRDGDPRGSYAIIDDNAVTLHRFEYDIDAAVEQMRSAGLDELIVMQASDVLRAGGSPAKTHTK